MTQRFIHRFEGEWEKGYATDVKPLSPDLLNLLLRTPDLWKFEHKIILKTREFRPSLWFYFA